MFDELNRCNYSWWKKLRIGRLIISKNRGFTLIELLAVIVILTIIMVITLPTIFNIVDNSSKASFKSSANGLIKTAEYNYTNSVSKNIIPDEIAYIYSNGVESSVPVGYTLDFKGSKPQNGIIIVNSQGEVAVAINNGKYCIEKSYKELKIRIKDYINKNECEITLPELIDKSGANHPVLVDGMTPVIWNGVEWEEPTNTSNPYEQDWYNYENKIWANAKTADGSFWVWIPRYAYQIKNGYHTNAVGSTNIKFLQGKSNISSDGTSIDLMPTYDGTNQLNYVVHPAFQFDSQNVEGVWVAKFEASNNTHEKYNQAKHSISTYEYTQLVEGKEYFLSHSSYLNAYYLGVIEPLEEDYNCNFYANKKSTVNNSIFNRIYVKCNVPYRINRYSTTNYQGLGLAEGSNSWYIWAEDDFVDANVMSYIMIHTSTTMYFNQSHATSNIYWTELDTTNPTTTLALNHNANIYNNHNSGFIKSIPNVSSWRGMVVNNIFDKVLDMKTNPIYGWSPTDTKIDTHMMKNTEWGAVAYLSHSTYGINDKIWLNPANDYTTGCSGASATSSSTIGCLYDYSTEQGIKASTSGNIYGIYDMVGGSFEYVMGNFNNKTQYGGFGDVEAIDNKYINRYNDYNSNFIGDAMYETSLSSTGNNSWYGGFSKKPTDSSPWLIRGASYKNNLEASVFGYQGYTGGGAPSHYGFRPVLVIKSN